MPRYDTNFGNGPPESIITSAGSRMMTRSIWKLAVGCLSALLLQTLTSYAADFPTKPVQLLVGFGPGGGVDLFARRVAQKLTEKWGQPVVVVNKPGASATIA